MRKKEIKVKPAAKSVTRSKRPKMPTRCMTAEGWKRHLFRHAQIQKKMKK